MRKAGVTLETHSTWFRHDTPDVKWLEVVGEKKWVILKRDKKIGERIVELNALIYSGARSFVLAQGSLPDAENAQIVIKALPAILKILDEHKHAFIAKIYMDSSVKIWKTEPVVEKGVKKKGRNR